MAKLKELPNLDGWNVNLLLAIMWQESKMGLDAKRFEPHVFKQRTGMDAKTYKDAIKMCDFEAESCSSHGFPQLMGYHFLYRELKKLKLASLKSNKIIDIYRNRNKATFEEDYLSIKKILKENIERMKKPEEQFIEMLEFIKITNKTIKKKTYRLSDYFKIGADIDFSIVANIYNGSGYAKNNYDVLIKQHYEKYLWNDNIIAAYHRGHKVHTEKFITVDVYDPRILKMQEELHVEVDGYFGRKTHEALNKRVEENTANYQELIGSELYELSKPLTEEQRNIDLSKPEERKKLFAGTFKDDDVLVLNQPMSDEPEKTARVFAETPIKNHDRTNRDEHFVLHAKVKDFTDQIFSDAQEQAWNLQEVKSVEPKAASSGGFVEEKEKNLSLFDKFLKWLRF